MKFYFVYVLLSLRDFKFYIGRSEFVERRFFEHQAGKNISTRRRGPFRLIFYEAFAAERDAVRRERYFKTAKGKTTLRQMLREVLDMPTQLPPSPRTKICCLNEPLQVTRINAAG